jgi:N-acetylglucosaminyldiphosphoundecaprenol N-acetyl-beta-D-mannosaminyltransferase
LAEIERFRPDILMVGMGMPRQEHWIVENLEHIHAHAILTSGACMDYLAGVVPIAPRWMGRFGVEWMFRLWSEPSRLWQRYLLEPWFLLMLLLRRPKKGK